MNTVEFEKSLFERIDILLQCLDDCSTSLSSYDLNNFENCINSLFKYHHIYKKNWGYLNRSIESNNHKSIS